MLNTCVNRAAIKLKEIDVAWDLILHPPKDEQEYAACFAAADQTFEAIDISPDSPDYATALAPVLELRQKASEEWQVWMKKRTLQILSSEVISTDP